MKTAIVYASVHHGNTKKIIDEIAKTNDVELIDATQTVEKDLSEYDLIGFASGVYGGKFHQSVLKFASVNLTDNKNVFLICTFINLCNLMCYQTCDQANTEFQYKCLWCACDIYRIHQVCNSHSDGTG